MRAAAGDLDAARARRRARDERRRPQRRSPDGSVLASGDNAALTILHGHRGHHAAGDHRPAARSAARSVAAEGRPGPRRVRPLPRDRHPGRDCAPRPCSGRPDASRRAPATGERIDASRRFKTIKVDDSAYAFEPADLLGAGERYAAQSAGVGDQRDARRPTALPRQAVLAADKRRSASPAGTRITVRAAIISTAPSARASDVSACR